MASGGTGSVVVRGIVLCVGNAKMYVSINLKQGLTVSFVL